MNTIISLPIVTTDLATEPVTLQEAKDWMAVKTTEEDDIIEDLITRARQMVEKYTGLSFGEKEITAVIHADGCGTPYALPYGPTISITSVLNRVAFSSSEVMVDGEDYQLQAGLFICRVEGLMEIVYEAGFLELPEELKGDILRVVAWLFQNRGIRFEADTEPLPFPEWNSLAANKYVQTVV